MAVFLDIVRVTFEFRFPIENVLAVSKQVRATNYQQKCRTIPREH